MKKRKDSRYVITETIDGKRKFFYGKSLPEAKSRRDAFIKSTDPDNYTFKDIVNQYLSLEETRISDAAYKTKKERINAFEPLFPKKLESITPQMIAVELNKLAVRNPYTNKPSAKRTVTRYLAALSNVFEFAISERYTVYNPTKYVKVPQNAPQIEREALLPEEYHLILDSAETSFLPAQIMILCGLRRGELTALTFGDISGTITVNKAWDFKENRLKLPKSKAGIREVPIPEKIKSTLQKLKASHKDSDYVINNNGQRFSESNWQYLRKHMIKALGFEFSWHQLRHTYATILYDAGVDVLSAQKFLGHSDVKVTLGIYTSLSEKKKEISIANLDKFLSA